MSAVTKVDQEVQAYESTQSVSPLAAMLSSGQHDVASIERLWEIQKEWEDKEARKAYYKAMASAREEMPMVKRNRRNSHLNSEYADLDAMIATSGPTVAKHGLCYSFKYDQSQPGYVRTICTCTHEMGHSDSTEATMPVMEPIRGKESGRQATNACQSVGVAMTYGQRRSFAALFSIATGDDNDANMFNAPPPIPVATAEQIKSIAELLKKADELIPGTKGRWMEAYGSKYPDADNVLGKSITESHVPKILEQLQDKIDGANNEDS